MLYERLRTGEEKERVAAFNGLRQLIIGRDPEISYRDDNRKEIQDHLNEAIKHCFSAPLIQAIRSNGSLNHALIGGSMRWVTESERGPSAGRPQQQLCKSHGSNGSREKDAFQSNRNVRKEDGGHLHKVESKKKETSINSRGELDF